MTNAKRSWDEHGYRLLRDFWYTHHQWLYYRTRSCVAARYYEQLMLGAASEIVDGGYVTYGPMPCVSEIVQSVGQPS